MRINPRFLIVPALVAGLQAAAAADITGTITLSGTPPEAKVNDALEQNPQCAALHTDPPKIQFYVVGSKGELKDVVVLIKGLTGKSTGESAAPLVLDQKGCEYIPYVSAVQTKQKILVRTEDPILHNVDIVPAVADNAAAIAGHSNQAQGPGAGDLAVSFPAEESFLKFKCDVHPWMFAYVTVVDSPYFAVSAADGTYKIANVPPGTYTIQAAHRKAGKATKDVEVKDANVTVDFTLAVP
jgi:hypothetical protein